MIKELGSILNLFKIKMDKRIPSIKEEEEKKDKETNLLLNHND